MSISTELGTQSLALTSQGPVSYRERGAGEPILFLHEWSTNADTYRRTVDFFADRYRLIFPDWPYAIHEVPMNRDADLSTPGLARIINELMVELDLRDVTLVGTGGGSALATVVAARHPTRVARLMLWTGDALEHFPAPKLEKIARIASFRPTSWLFAHARRIPAVGNWYYGRTCKHPLDEDVIRSYCEIPAKNPAARRDLRKAVGGIRSEYSVGAVEALRDFPGPVTVAWGPEDQIFPLEDGYRLSRMIESAELELVEDTYSYPGSDRPDRFVELIDDLMSQARRS